MKWLIIEALALIAVGAWIWVNWKAAKEADRWS